MNLDFQAQAMLALAGATLEIARETLNVSKTTLANVQENLRVNTLTFNATLKHIELEGMLLEAINTLNNNLNKEKGDTI